MLAIKSDTRYRLKQNRVKYTAIWKKSMKIVKESKLSFLPRFPPQFFNSLLHNFIIFAPHFWIPSSTILIFSLNFFYSLQHNFNIFPQFYYFRPQCYYSLLHNFIISLFSVIIPSSTILLFSLLLFLISIVFPRSPPHFDCFPSSSSSTIRPSHLSLAL